MSCSDNQLLHVTMTAIDLMSFISILTLCTTIGSLQSHIPLNVFLFVCAFNKVIFNCGWAGCVPLFYFW